MNTAKRKTATEDIPMRKQFLVCNPNMSPAKRIKLANKKTPWWRFLAKVDFGILAFESESDYNAWLNETSVTQNRVEWFAEAQAS